MAYLKTSVTITARDRFSSSAKKISGATGKLGKRIAATQREIAALGGRAAKIGQFEKLTSAIGKTGSEMRRTQEGPSPRLRGKLVTIFHLAGNKG